MAIITIKSNDPSGTICESENQRYHHNLTARTLPAPLITAIIEWWGRTLQENNPQDQLQRFLNAMKADLDAANASGLFSYGDPLYFYLINNGGGSDYVSHLIAYAKDAKMPQLSIPDTLLSKGYRGYEKIYIIPDAAVIARSVPLLRWVFIEEVVFSYNDIAPQAITVAELLCDQLESYLDGAGFLQAEDSAQQFRDKLLPEISGQIRCHLTSNPDQPFLIFDRNLFSSNPWLLDTIPPHVIERSKEWRKPIWPLDGTSVIVTRDKVIMQSPYPYPGTTTYTLFQKK